MRNISIVTAFCADQIRDRLSFEKRFLVEEGINVNIDEREQGDLTFFKCNINNIDEFMSNEDISRLNFEELFKDYIISALADIIVNDLEVILIDQIINNQCQDYAQDEQKFIYKLALDKLNLLKEKEDETFLSQMNKKNRIKLELSHYLDINDKIILEGFIRFRLKDYFKELVVAVECAKDDFMMEKEYEEFINLLRYFVDIQEPQVKLVHVVKDSKSGYKLLDDSHEIIQNEYLQGFVLEMVDDELHYEDLLISALITVAPKKIKLHLKEDSDVVETVKNVFNDKVVTCQGCEYCNKASVNKVLESER
ncbi:putative sporulation protein YtxC [Selenihalanaerobacter shriftii]|uniref:Putative sporulation protein YtxC n=1 Tax=Selenihalanaerobacter shriftii TaxID=142842 RepID=A0A1T4PRM8_9FIRM|nr:putative sporulation protein YtxC [Selenihalanaerobacter shriftii]SJZ94252.1 putative sporulation protein YtxC [Selenihalanaerobacter shriftii]